MFRKLTVLASLSLALLAFGCSDDDCPTCTDNGPVLGLNKHKIDLGSSSTTANFVISNKGTGNLAWDLSIAYRFAAEKPAAPAHGGWLELSTLAGQNDGTVTLTINRAELDELGASRAVIIVNTPGAVNTTRDSIDVHILNSGELVITDDGTFEACQQVGVLDYYWVKGFEMPHGQERVFIDSVSVNFCQGDTVIQLLAYDAAFDQSIDLYVPFNAIGVSNSFFTVFEGWNTFPVDWYVPNGPIFYAGYFQLGGARPDLRIDTSSDTDTLCWVARDVSQNPGESLLEWQWFPNFETFAIRVFVSPVLEYNPKMIAAQSRGEIESALKTGYAYKGKYPMSVNPSIPR
ncbi:MAG: hypothetical protein IPH59_11115 [bacterium]|nr:hypothetical protein [bacterium]